MVGDDADYRVELRDVYEGIEERGLDRIVLDLPEPWRVVPHAGCALRSGGLICAYLPTINQTAQFRHALEESPFGMPGRSRCSTGRGTSRTVRCAPTTAWWATPASSPRPGCCGPRSSAAGRVDRWGGCRRRRRDPGPEGPA